MNPKKILLAIFVFVFFLGSPYFLLKSLGLRPDLKNRRLVRTSALFFKTYPPASEVVIRGYGSKRTHFLTGNLLWSGLPSRTPLYIEVKKKGFRSYVKETELVPQTTLELKHLVLFPSKPFFEIFSIGKVLQIKGFGGTIFILEKGLNENIYRLWVITSKNKELWWEDVIMPQRMIPLGERRVLLGFENSSVYIKEGRGYSFSFPVLKAIAEGDNIWLLDTALNLYLWRGKLELVERPVEDFKFFDKRVWLKKEGMWADKQGRGWDHPFDLEDVKREVRKENTLFFLTYKGELWLYDLARKWEPPSLIAEEVLDFKMRPDGSAFVYLSKNREVWLYALGDLYYPEIFKKGEKRFLTRQAFPVNDLEWLGSNFLVLGSREGVRIAEIDRRGGLNTWLVFSQPGYKIWVLEKRIFWFDGEKLYSSQKLVP